VMMRHVDDGKSCIVFVLVAFLIKSMNNKQ
jgi:hypothetical protein